MTATHQFFALLLVLFGTGCADDMPVAARYVPAECPPCAVTAPEMGDMQAPDPPRVDGGSRSGAAPEEPPVASDDSSKKLVDLNTATAAELVTLPGVGPALAARIIAYREKRAFEKPTDLQRVRGIGPAKFAKMAAVVSVRSAQKRRP